MAKREKFLSLKNQFFVCLGFAILLCGLLLNFYSENYPMFLTFKHLFIIVDCIGGVIILLSLFLAFYLRRENLKELGKQLIIESSLVFAFNFSLQAVVFHLLFNNSLLPASLGVFFVFISYCFLFIVIPFNLTLFLFKRYHVLYFTTVGFVSVSTVVSGVFLTFTGSIEEITSNGIGVLSVGVISISALVFTFIFYPKWKFILLDEKIEEEEKEESGIE